MLLLFPAFATRKALRAIIVLVTFVKGFVAHYADIKALQTERFHARVADGTDAVSCRLRNLKGHTAGSTLAVEATVVLRITAHQACGTVVIFVQTVPAQLTFYAHVLILVRAPSVTAAAKDQRSVVIAFPMLCFKVSHIHHFGRNRHGTDDRYEHDHKCDREQFKNSFFHRIFSFFQIFAGTARRKYFGISPILK
jgi:hypothetical protein